MEDRTYEGRAYAVLDDDGTLTLFRSAEKYAEGTTCRTRDVLGTERHGITWECPEGPVSGDDPLPGWLSHKQGIRNVRVAHGQAIKPVSCAEWFSGGNRIESVGLAGLDTSQVMDMNSMFYSCESLEALDLSGWNTSHVTDMRGMFAECFSLEFLDLFDWDTSKVRDMSSMFDGCHSLRSLDLSHWDVLSVERADKMFRDCRSLRSLDLSGWVTGSPYIELIFEGCNQLDSPRLPDEPDFKREWCNARGLAAYEER